MKAVIQRVSEASVCIENKIVSQINTGLLILLGIELEDTKEDSKWLASKIAQLRIFSDSEGKMNHSLLEFHLSYLGRQSLHLHYRLPVLGLQYDLLT